MELRISGVIKQSIVDGNGLRFTIFTQGCPHYCKGCHNPQTHAINGGYITTTERVLEVFKQNPLLAGIAFSGGEPMLQPQPLTEIAKAVIAMGKDCICYSGFTFEQILATNDPAKLELLANCKWLIDGKYIDEQRDLTLLFRGSKNQRIIDLAPSLATGKPVIIPDISLLPK